MFICKWNMDNHYSEENHQIFGYFISTNLYKIIFKIVQPQNLV